MRHFLPALVTGLLQTPEYMRAAMQTPVQPATADIGKAVTLKLERQEILHDSSKKFAFLITESALRWQLCEPSVMALQIDRLVSLSWLPNIRLGILRLTEHVRDGAYHTFVIYDERLVTIELFTGQVVLRDPKEAMHYRDLFRFFSSHALWGEEARAFLTRTADSFRSGRLCEHAHKAGG